MVALNLKYLSNFWRSLEINVILNWSGIYFLVTAIKANQVPTFKITDTKLYIQS